ncbi:cytochrome c heme-lyase [Tieghemostelium lacteum]|uniref:Holocytochrome c-type synthase n=1 Tax=Tieghemostelium lacteum TaxID=361077 RepID=A0A151Z3D4_TIELA|nr:cytochrome c heme-lyase [Tieghemostelium lacteum]|eukprot:KYQ88472.1 cytochrome c heme-lyase [Tieghemostelium lacteum]
MSNNSADNNKPANNALEGGCPIAHDINPTNNMYKPNQNPHPDQTKPLSKDRITSSIPRTDNDKWQYPSPQMFFNAMKRKQYSPNEDDMEVVISIHNTVNEKCWEHVLDWESLHKEENVKPKLIKFKGRAQDFSPKARFLNTFLGYKLPFDRHDWIVDRNGKQVRYVIDFYEGKLDKDANKPIGIYLDVRPAIDDLSSLMDRMKKLF